jgi:transcriptional regulator with XRE-family HTH domain
MYEKYLDLLEKTGETTYMVAKATGISQTSLSDYKSGRSKPKTPNLKKLADHFGVSIEYFLD